MKMLINLLVNIYNQEMNNILIAYINNIHHLFIQSTKKIIYKNIILNYLNILGWVNLDKILASLIFLISGVIATLVAVVEKTEKKSSVVAYNLL